MKFAAKVCCFLIGVLFIFSGFVKAVDPLGFAYKLQEYFDVFHLTFFNDWAVGISIFLCVLEMALGFFTLFRIRMRLTAWLLLLLMIYFTLLTGYSAITGKITDCGCFGDAIKLTPWQTFDKDIVSLILILIIFFYRRNLEPVFGMAWSILIGAAGLFISAFIPIRCYMHLPYIDFRPYKIGNNIRDEMKLPPGTQPDQYMTILTYKDKSSGQQADYAMVSNGEDQQAWFKQKGLLALPWQDSLWMNSHEFVNSKSELVQAGQKPAITDFKVWDNDNNDLTSMVLDTPQYHFWLVCYDMTAMDQSSFGKINALQQACEKNSIPFVGLTATPYDQMDPIRHDLNAAFPFYYSDGTVLKTIIRSNPGLVLLKGSVVEGMWAWRDIPSFDEVKEKYLK